MSLRKRILKRLAVVYRGRFVHLLTGHRLEEWFEQGGVVLMQKILLMVKRNRAEKGSVDHLGLTSGMSTTCVHAQLYAGLGPRRSETSLHAYTQHVPKNSQHDGRV